MVCVNIIYKVQLFLFLVLFLAMVIRHAGQNYFPWGTVDSSTHSRWNHVVVHDLLSQPTISSSLCFLQWHHDLAVIFLSHQRQFFGRLHKESLRHVYHFPKSSGRIQSLYTFCAIGRADLMRASSSVMDSICNSSFVQTTM